MLAGRIAQGDRGAFEQRGRHLARHRALEDEVVELALVPRPGAFAGEIGRADRLVRFLRVLRLGAVHARLLGTIILAEARRDGVARGHNRAHVHLHPVGAHIGDRAGLVEALRQPHRVLRREAELAGGFLLQGRGGEGRRGVALDRLGLDAFNREAAGFDRRLGFHGNALVTETEAFQLHALELDQTRVELGAVVLHLGEHAPVFLRPEGLDLALSLDDQTQRDRLHAARAFGAGELAPQHRRKCEAEQIIQRAARQIGVDQRLIELARLLHRPQNGGLGDRVEGDAVDLHRQALALSQQFLNVPADRLALTVGVGGEHEAGRALGRVGDFLEAALLVAVEFPLHRKVGIGIDAAVLGRQVADMAIGGEDLEVLAQILLDGFGLGRRFYDDKLHDGELWISLTCTYARWWGGPERAVKPVASHLPVAQNTDRSKCAAVVGGVMMCPCPNDRPDADRIGRAMTMETRT